MPPVRTSRTHREMTRRELREQNRRSRISFSKMSKNSARALLVGLLGISTILVPLTGVISPNLSIAAAASVDSSSETLLSHFVNMGDEHKDSGLEAVPATAMFRLRQAVIMGACKSDENAANGDIQAAKRVVNLQWPMNSDSFTFTSDFGYRVHPITGSRVLHEGVDMGAPIGVPIYAIANGTVELAGNWGSGFAIYIRHNIDGQTIYSGYLHMYRNGILVKEGQEVKAGQMIARVGNSGMSTGPHLHFEIRNDKKEPQDPVAFMKDKGAPFPDMKCS